MSTTLVVNGTSYAYPATGDQNWGDQASAWASAVTSGMLQKAGGTFTLTSDVNFGANFGLISKYFTSVAANSAASGVLRLATGDAVSWRNNANGADIALSKNTSDQLLWNSVVLADVSSAQTLTNKTMAAGSNTISGLTNSNLSGSAGITYANLSLGNSILNSDISPSAAITYSKLSLTGSVVNADISNSAAIAYSKLSLTGSVVNADISNSAAIAYSKLSLTGAILNADLAGSIARSKLATLTASRAMVTDGSGNDSASSVTATELGYVSGVTSAIQTQVDAKIAKSVLTTKGDTLVATGSATVVRQPIGSDGQVLVSDASQANGLKWTTLQQGAKNYITYGNFENNATTGWSLGTIGTLTNNLPTGSPTFGSGASGNLSISTVSSGQLAGTYSLSYASSAATTQGNMLASQAYSIDIEDQAKVLTWKFYYSAVTNPANCNFSGTSSNSFAVAVYDVTNSAWLPTTAAFGMTQGTGVGMASGTFQTAATTASLRFVIYNANATSGAATLYFDDFTLGPQTAPIGSVTTDWQSFTPTTANFGTGSFTSNAAKYRRVGDSLEVQGQFVMNAAGTGASTATLTIPSGLTIDTAKMASSGSVNQIVGMGENATSGAEYQIHSNLTSTINFYNSSGATPGSTFSAGSTWSYEFKVPISGWSSNVQMSSDTDTRVVAMQVSQASPTATITSSMSLVKFTSGVAQDTHGAFSTSTGLYTVPVSGFYRVTASLYVTGTYALNSTTGLQIQKNGSAVQSGTSVAAGAVTALFPTVATTVYCNAGDTLAPYTSSSATSPTVGGSAPLNFFNVERLSGPSVIAATESVNGYYYTTAGPTVNNTGPTITFGTKVYDSHGAMSGSTLTAPVSGLYSFNMFSQSASTAWTSATALQNLITVAGTQYIVSSNRAWASVTGLQESGGSIDLRLNAGDQVTFQVYSDISTTLNTTAHRARVQWKRVGN